MTFRPSCCNRTPVWRRRRDPSRTRAALPTFMSQRQPYRLTCPKGNWTRSSPQARVVGNLSSLWNLPSAEYMFSLGVAKSPRQSPSYSVSLMAVPTQWRPVGLPSSHNPRPKGSIFCVIPTLSRLRPGHRPPNPNQYLASPPPVPVFATIGPSTHLTPDHEGAVSCRRIGMHSGSQPISRTSLYKPLCLSRRSCCELHKVRKSAAATVDIYES